MSTEPNTSENMEQDLQSMKNTADRVNNARKSANRLQQHIKNGRNRNRINPKRGSQPGEKAAKASKTGKDGLAAGGKAGRKRSRKSFTKGEARNENAERDDVFIS